MKSISVRAAAILIVATLLTVPLSAQQTTTQAPENQAPRYRLVDLGTFGGPNSAEFALPLINKRGEITGAADTAETDPNAPNCYNYYDCFVTHTYIFSRKGILTDLGALPGGSSSEGNGINDYGQIAGQSLNGLIDPLLGTPAAVAVKWGSDGRIVDLGTLGGNESLAATLNNRGQVVGAAANAITDSFPGPLGFWGTQTRAFLWEKGVMRDLGDLGGPDSFAIFVNERGAVAGVSYTSTIPDPTQTDCGQDIPPQDPFLWESGKMIDLGTFGGVCGFVNGLNNSGQVIGWSDLAGDLIAHPFLWDPNAIPHLRDLGTLGGSKGQATVLNDAGDVAGGATTQDDQEFHAFFWRKGVMTDLGTIGEDTCSIVHSMNARGEVSGTSFDCWGPELHGFLWQPGGSIIDLNDFVPPGSDLTLTDGEAINDRGEIAGTGMLPNGDFHAIVLIPCDAAHGDSEGCQDSGQGLNAHPSRPDHAVAHIVNDGRRLSLPDLLNGFLFGRHIPRFVPTTK